MTSLGLIIGRFQPLHKGHLLLIETSLRENPTTLILIGSINKTDADNPYSFELRKSLIKSEFSDEKTLSVGALPDFPSDREWLDCTLNSIPKNISQLNIYCGDQQNDSAIQSIIALQDALSYTLNIIEIPRSIIPISATQVREYIQEKNIEKLQEFLGEKTLEKLLR